MVIELQSDEGLINAFEGEVAYHQLLASGFSYGAIPVRVSILTYSEYTARGFNLGDEFDSDVIPPDAADGTVLINISRLTRYSLFTYVMVSVQNLTTTTLSVR